MAVEWKLVVDCADANRIAAFWAAALGYVQEDHHALIEKLRGFGAVTDADLTTVDGHAAFAELAAVRHPGDPHDPESDMGQGRRILFQAVPEPKTVKNRLHIDLHMGPDARDTEVERLTGLGARVVAVVKERGSHHVTMADPEGNEFDVQ